MADKERKRLMWDNRTSLLSLSPINLFDNANHVGPVPGEEQPTLEEEDHEGCYDHICGYIYSEHHLQSEDKGMTDFLVLKDKVDDMLQSQNENRVVKTVKSVDVTTVDGNANASVNVGPTESTQAVVTSEAMHIQFSDTVNTTTVNTDHVYAVSDMSAAMTDSVGATTNVELQKMLLSYEELGRKLKQCIDTPATQSLSSQHLLTPPAVGNRDPHTLHPAHTSHTPQTRYRPEPNTHQTGEKVVSLRELSYLHRREFKIQGGQIGDNTSDITYNNVCRQIDEGIQEGFSYSEVVRAVLRIIKPGNFKDMLINQEDVTVEELKGFLQSHLREKESTELFQELMCAKQNDNETPQQFLYRVIGLKQKILFTSSLPDANVKYSRGTVQDIFLHTVYQGLGHKHNDIRRELKPLLADNNVKDELILRHVMRITSEESERLRRLGPTPRQNQTKAHSAQLETNEMLEANAAQAQGAKRQAVEPAAGLDIIQQLSAKIEALTKVVDSLKQPTPVQPPEQSCQCPKRKPTTTGKERTSGCPKCVEQGLSHCRHCFVCGEEGHRAVGCIKRPRNQGNWSRSLQGGTQ